MKVLFKTAFVVSAITFTLALSVFAWMIFMSFTVWNGGGGGEGGYIMLAQMMFGVFAFSLLALISFLTAVLSSFGNRPARWLVVPTMLLVALAAWFLTRWT